MDDLAAIEAADVGKPIRQSAMTLPGAAAEGAYFCDLATTMDEEQGSPVRATGTGRAAGHDEDWVRA